MSNWKIGDKIKEDRLVHLPDDTIVWIEWVDGLAGPVMMEDFREQGSTGGVVYNLRVQTAVQPDEVKKRWNSIFE